MSYYLVMSIAAVCVVIQQIMNTRLEQARAESMRRHPAGRGR